MAEDLAMAVGRKVRTAAIISGTGSNMLALAEACGEPSYPASLNLVISNRPDAPGLAAASALGIDTAVVDHTRFDSRAPFERELGLALTSADIELVALAGFMRILTPDFVAAWEGRMVNIHPSLLPKYKGLHTHRRALEAGDTRHGASVHWVTADLDSGTIVAQHGFTVPEDATEASLAADVKALEHRLYPRALAVAARHVHETFTRG